MGLHGKVLVAGVL